MNALPSVSVVIPTRDRPQLLRRAVRDILAQTYDGPIEVIVVFDQSTPDVTLDRTGELRSVQAIANHRTPGLAGARNAGLMRASGELVAFCDDDDEWLPGKIAAQVAALRSCDAPAIAACGIYIERNGKTMIRLPDETKATYEGFLEERIMEVNPCTILVDRELVLDKIGLVDEELPGSYAEDYEWLLRAIRVAEVVIVPEPLAVIHWATGSFFAERWQMIYDAIEQVIEKHPDLLSSRRGLARLRGQQAFAAAAMGDRRRAIALIREVTTLHPREPRAVAAAVAASGVVPAGRIVRFANALGRGI